MSIRSPRKWRFAAGQGGGEAAAASRERRGGKLETHTGHWRVAAGAIAYADGCYGSWRSLINDIALQIGSQAADREQHNRNDQTCDSRSQQEFCRPRCLPPLAR